MSFLYCRIPNFPLAVAQRDRPEFASTPLAIVGQSGHVCALSDEAIHSGVARHMDRPEAKLSCPQLQFLSISDIKCEQAQSALLAILGKWEIPVETFDWGEACIDLRTLTARHNEIRVLASDLGQRVRQTLGPTFTPQLGWGSTVLASRAVALDTPVGYIRIGGQTNEPFISRPHREAAFAGFLANHRRFDANQNQRKDTQTSMSEQRFRNDFVDLIAHYGPIFWQPRLVAAEHPLAEERSRYIRL